MKSIQLFSPAKLNLFFRVLHKRSDGFHEIASLYQAINLGDDLQITLAEKDQLFCESPEIPLDKSNLILKAAEFFRQKTSLSCFADFYLTKRIPIQAGLGGGSGNAATTLWGLNELTGRPATLDQLKSWGGELGSDVAFFFSKGTAYCTGRGEQIKEVPLLHSSLCWIAKPEHLSLATPLVYKQCQPHLFPQRDPLKTLASFETDCPLFYNDLEIPSFALCPELLGLRQKLLLHGFEQVMMTGSGTAFFCLGDIEPPPLEGIQFFKSHFISRSLSNWY